MPLPTPEPDDQPRPNSAPQPPSPAPTPGTGLNSYAYLHRPSIAPPWDWTEFLCLYRINLLLQFRPRSFAGLTDVPDRVLGQIFDLCEKKHVLLRLCKRLLLPAQVALYRAEMYGYPLPHFRPRSSAGLTDLPDKVLGQIFDLCEKKHLLLRLCKRLLLPAGMALYRAEMDTVPGCACTCPRADCQGPKDEVVYRRFDGLELLDSSPSRPFGRALKAMFLQRVDKLSFEVNGYCRWGRERLAREFYRLAETFTTLWECDILVFPSLRHIRIIEDGRASPSVHHACVRLAQSINRTSAPVTVRWLNLCHMPPLRYIPDIGRILKFPYSHTPRFVIQASIPNACPSKDGPAQYALHETCIGAVNCIVIPFQPEEGIVPASQRIFITLEAAERHFLQDWRELVCELQEKQDRVERTCWRFCLLVGEGGAGGERVAEGREMAPRILGYVMRMFPALAGRAEVVAMTEKEFTRLLLCDVR
ncbi:hypothetical protein IAT38_001479 [Cryptococcus sp. DSM 104549]